LPSLRPARRRVVGVSARLVSLQMNCMQCFMGSRIDRGIDAAATDNAEDESPAKKKASPTKRKGKAAAMAASEEEGEAPVKSEAEASAEDDA